MTTTSSAGSSTAPVRPAARTANRLRDWAVDVLWGPESGAHLLVAYTGLSVLIGLRIALGPYRAMADTPDSVFDPVPFLGWLGGMPSPQVVLLIQIAGTLAAVCAAARRWPRAAFAVAWLSYLILAGLRGSRGKILHNDLLLLWVSAPFLLAPVTINWRDRVPRRLYGWPIRVGVVLTVLIYFFAGYHKMVRTGPSWVFSDNMLYVMRWGPGVGTAPWEWAGEWIADTPWAAMLTAAGILGIELTIPLVLVWRRLLPAYAVGAVLLHVGTFLTLGLDYWAWIGAVLLLFVDWPKIFSRCWTDLSSSRASDGPGSSDLVS